LILKLFTVIFARFINYPMEVLRKLIFIHNYLIINQLKKYNKLIITIP
jgi:hypothetical protein